MTAAPPRTGRGGTARPHARRPGSAADQVSRPHSLRLVAWTGGLVLAARALHATGGTFRVPTDSWSSARDWVGAATPVELAGAALRLTAIAAIWYLLAATIVALVADRVGRPAPARLLARLTPALVRRMVVRGSGAGLAIGALLGSALPTDTATDGVRGPTPALVSLLPALPGPARAADDTAGGAPDGTATMIRQPPGHGTPGDATMIRLPDDGGVAGDPGAAGRPRAGEPPATGRPAPPEGGASPDSASSPQAVGARAPRQHPDARTGSEDAWVVAPGDSFWSIATEVITEAGGARRPRDRDVAPYWRELIAANRERLVVPDDPDILLPGQQLRLPAPAVAPRAT